MLYNLEPDRSVTGGAWYSDNDFESEFVDVLNQQCFKFLEQKAASAKETNPDPMGQRNGAFASSTDVQNFITQLGISKVGDCKIICGFFLYFGTSFNFIFLLLV